MKIKKIISGIMAVLVVFGTMPVFSVNPVQDYAVTASAEDYDDYTEGTYKSLGYKKYSDHIEISDCDESATKVEIPVVIEGLPVTSIGSFAFYECSSLKTITIPDSVTSIERGAFFGCSSLTGITIPDSVTIIGYCAFFGCSSLTSIKILNPECEIYDGSDTICTEQDDDWNDYFNGTIYGYENSTAQAYAKKYGYNFESIGEAPKADKNLRYEKYSDYIEITGCDESAKKVIIPVEIDGLPVTSIGEGAFSGCSSLTEITIPDSVTNIGMFAFSNTPWLEARQKENPLVIVNNILIDGTACEGDVVIPDGVTSISNNAFYYCESLELITIPESVTSIGDYSFAYCSGLTSIIIPENVTSIGYYAFSYCESLESIIIPDGVTSIGKGTFYECSGLTSITIPESLTYIGSYAFYCCEGLESITIPESVTSVGELAFCGTPWLEARQKENPLVIVNNILIDGTTCEGDVVIPDRVTSIGDNAFEGCSSLESITIPDSVTSIGDCAFDGCSGLTSITIPDGVTSIGLRVFEGCSSLESITILNPDCKIYDISSTICNGYDDDNNEYYFNGTIYGYENSIAQAYAEKYGYNFETIGEIENPKTLLGDANCDGEISVADATLVLQYCGNKDKYKLSKQGLINADVDGTAGISAVDALRIQQYDAGIIDKF